MFELTSFIERNTAISLLIIILIFWLSLASISAFRKICVAFFERNRPLHCKCSTHHELDDEEDD
jgi:hypothetical protein